jgi:thioredoxin reductase (NADPH)
VLVMDQGPLVASLQAYPTDLEFFTTRERLEIADVPFAIAEVKPNRRQALVYYREVVNRYDVPLALYETVERVVRPADTGEDDGLFRVESTLEGGHPRVTRARAVAIATGYFWTPKTLGVPGEELPWVRLRYVEPYPHMGRRVMVVGGGNSAAKNALDLWRNGAQVTLVHRRAALKPSVKYWIKPDIENRIDEGSIDGRFETRVVAFHDGPEREVELERVPAEGTEGGGDGQRERIATDTVYVQIGYVPDVALQRAAGIEVDPESAIPTFDPETCETNVPGLYVAGTVQSGRHTNRIFIENSRDHGIKITEHLRRRLGRLGPDGG